MGEKKVLLILCVFAWLLINQIQANSFDDDAMVEGFAMGSATTAISDSLDSLYKNPAMSGFINRAKVTLHYSKNPSTETSVYAFSGVRPTRMGTFGFSIPVRTVSDIPETIEEGNRGEQIGFFSDTQTSIKMSFATKFLSRFSLGVSSTYHMQTLYSESSTGYSFDVGGAYSGQRLAIGASVSDLVHQSTWSTGRKEKNSSSKHAGISFAVLDNTKIAVDGDFKEGKARCNIGLDWKPSEHLDVLIGIKDLTSEKDVRLGLNLNLLGMALNYAMSVTGPLGIVHKAGITLQL